MKKSSPTTEVISFIRNWNQIKVDAKTLKKWSQIKITKEDIQKVLKS